MLKVIGKELFKVVREKYGGKLNSLIQEKVIVLFGDITCDSFGLDSNTLENLFGQVNVVINLAATTNFDERYYLPLSSINIYSLCKFYFRVHHF